MRFVLLLTLTLFFGLLPIPTQAQSPRLDPSLPPEHGSTVLGTNFTPDPYRGQSIQGGGEVEISEVLRGDDCTGYTSAAPDYAIELRADLPLLRLIFIADVVTADAMMVVRTPSGDMLCADDSFGVFAPSLDFRPAPAGEYRVWIGAFTVEPVYGSLYITRRADVIPNSSGVEVPNVEPSATPPGYIDPTAIPGTFLDPALTPRAASLALNAGFFPDPYWAFAEGGGSLDVPAFDLQRAADQITFGSEIGGGSLGEIGGGACAGFTTPEPAFALDWTGQSGFLSLFFVSVNSGANASMVVHAPDGTWTCSRDAVPDMLDPMVTFNNPPQGLYTVWLANELVRAQPVFGALFLSELPDQSPLTAVLPSTDPLPLPLVGLEMGAQAAEFKPDPLLNPVMGGGSVDLGSLNPGEWCPGFYPVTNTFALALSSSLPYLRAFVANADPETADPTLVALMPDGQWYCGDDWQGLTDPVIDVLGGTGTGIAYFWVGSYSAGETFGALLGLTRGTASPNNPTGAS
ncbi:MAG: hypothetical protein U0670_15580 [Anaerolineae bacterium]